MNSSRLHALLVSGILVCAVAPRAQTAGVDADRDETLQSGGHERAYHVHLPPDAKTGRPRPLVLVFHGGGGTGLGAARLYGFNQLADARGFLVAYPDGIGRRWNDGRSPTGERWLSAPPQDDVGFVSALIDHLRAEFPIDPRRMYATGMSNGGILSHRLGCELSGKIAAIAPVAGTIAMAEAPRCTPGAPVSVIEWHGTEDRYVPYGGGDILGRPRAGRVLSLDATAALWATLDGCPREAQRSNLAPADPADATRVRRSAYGPCRSGSDVAVYTIEGGGHTWPGTAPIAILGPTTRQINATQVTWEFFERHPRR
jgi:polyhydroxybutyrate depolymerase